MVKRYAFVWHIATDMLNASEGASGSYCSAYETESENELAAETIMHMMAQRDMAFCKVSGCEHIPIVVSELTPKMFMGRMTANMKEITTPTSKRELVLRVMSTLGAFTKDQLVQAQMTFPLDVIKFLNDPDCLEKPTQKEIHDFELGENFLNQVYPRIKKRLSA